MRLPAIFFASTAVTAQFSSLDSTNKAADGAEIEETEFELVFLKLDFLRNICDMPHMRAKMILRKLILSHLFNNVFQGEIWNLTKLQIYNSI